MRVGFIGLGSQGGPMARRIVEGGYDTTLWARRAASLEPYRRHRGEDRAAHLPSWRPPATWSACAWSATTTSERCSTATPGCWPGWRPGGIVAIHSTVHPDTCREIAEKAAAQGVSVIDAPVSGGAPAVEEGKLLVMVGGDEDVVERCRPVFATYADPIVHLGPLGSGQVTKILNNLLFTANLGSAISTLELGESLGIPRDRLCEVLNSGSATSKALGSIAVFGGTLDGLAPIAGALLQKDVRHAASIADTASAPAGCGVRRGRRRAEVDGTSAMTRVGFVGAGRMGAPMVRRLVDAGHEVRALGRTPEKCAAVERIGRAAGDRAGRRRRGADVVIVCVFTDEQVRQVCLESDLLAAMRAGRGRSSSTPRAARAPPRRSPRARAASAWSTRRSAAARTTSPRAR